MYLSKHYIDFNNDPLSQVLHEESKQFLETTELPNRKVETWKYTNISNELEKSFALARPKNQDFDKVFGFTNLFFSNGKLIENKSDNDDFSCAMVTDAKELESIVTQMDKDFKKDYATSLQLLLHDKVYKIKVPKNTSLSKPILIHHSITDENSFAQSFLIIEMEEGSKAQVCETYEEESKNQQFFSMTIINSKANSNLEHVLLQTNPEAELVLNNVHINCEKDSYCSQSNLQLGMKKSRSYISADLVGSQAELHLNGLNKLIDEQHADTYIKVNHKAAHSYSHQLYKSLLDDKSKSIFTGCVDVDRQAQNIDAKQLNKKLLLSAKAHAFSRPQMEINADDVKCAHGSTTGQMSDDEIFYFESRGISKERAQKILSKAFLNDVLLKVENLPLRKYLMSNVYSEEK